MSDKFCQSDKPACSIPYSLMYLSHPEPRKTKVDFAIALY